MLLEGLTSLLGGPTLGRLASRLGTDEATTGAELATAVPVLVSTLARNASSRQGAESLVAALRRDHDGSVLGNSDGVLAGRASGRSADGAGIIGHLLGARRSRIEYAVSKQSGLDASSVAMLLPLLAPIVMGMLGRTTHAQGLDASGLASALGAEASVIERQTPGLGRVLGSLMDLDGDGAVADGALGLGGGLIGGRLLRSYLDD